jgi:hypothetical protein
VLVVVLVVVVGVDAPERPALVIPCEPGTNRPAGVEESDRPVGAAWQVL